LPNGFRHRLLPPRRRRMQRGHAYTKSR
jgi:hypothetical protein